MGSGASRQQGWSVFNRYDRRATEIDVAKKRQRTVPASIGRFSSLKKLILRDNLLSSLPDELANLASLEVLDLSLNRFEEIPQVVVQLKGIVELNMDGNMLTTVPSNIEAAGTLKKITLTYNKIKELPLSMFSLNLALFTVRGNCLTDLPQNMHKYKSVTRAVLSDNRFELIPAEVWHHTDIIELCVDKNRLSQIQPEIAKLDKLERLNLSHNKIRMVPAELFTMPRLTFLSIGHNLIEAVPPQIGRAADLKILILRHNRLRTLPEEMKHLTKLQVLDLAQNAIEEFPLVLTQLARLVSLNIASNHLKLLPRDLAELSRLKKLGLEDNCLNDEALEVLFTMTGLEWLFLKNNIIRRLSPEITEAMKNLKRLSLEGNPMENIPEEIMKKYMHVRSPRKATANGVKDAKDNDNRTFSHHGTFSGEQTFTVVPNKQKDEKIMISNTFALEIPPEAVSQQITFHVAYADGEDDKNAGIIPKEGYKQESELIDVTPRPLSFGSDVSLAVRLESFDDPSRDLVIMQSDDMAHWKALQAYQDGPLIRAKLTHLSALVVVSKPHVDEMALGDNGGKFESTGVKDVSVSFPGGAVDAEESIIMEVDPIETTTPGGNDALCDDDKDVTLSPCLSIKIASGNRHLEFNKDVEVTLPIPPPIRGKEDEDTDLRVLRDASDNDTWKDMTDDVGPLIRHGKLASFTIRSFSSYAVARTDRLKRNRVAGIVSRTRKLQKSRKRPVSYKVKILLMQLSMAWQKMVICLVVDTRLREKRREFVDSGYSSYDVPYSGDIMMKRGETVDFDVAADFAFTNENRRCVFYPNRDNTSHVYVEDREDRNCSQSLLTSFMKFYNKDKKLIAELPFKIFLATERAGSLARRLTDSSIVFEDDEDYDFFFNFLAGTLLTSFESVMDLGYRLGLAPEQIALLRNTEMRQQMYQMLLMWRRREEKKSGKAEMKTVVTALREQRFEDHASSLQRFRVSDPNTDIRGAMRHVACNIDPREMKMLARSLGLKETEIETIRYDHPNDAKEQSYQMLLLWVRKAGRDATITRLAETMVCTPALKQLSDELVATFEGVIDKENAPPINWK